MKVIQENLSEFKFSSNSFEQKLIYILNSLKKNHSFVLCGPPLSGKTQKECADILNITLRAWQGYEYGQREAKYELLCKIADMFGVSVDYLLGREPQPNPLATLNVNVNDDKFIEIYSQLPEYAKQIFIDTMIKLSEAGQQPKKKP